MTPYYRKLLSKTPEEGEPEEDNTIELLERLETLCGNILDGDDSTETNNEFATIVEKLHDHGEISDVQREQLYEKYLKN